MTPNADYPSKTTSMSDIGASDRMRDTLDHASHKVGDMARSAGDMARSAGERLGDVASTVRDKLTDGGRSARDMVIDNPVRSMAIGLGIGIVVGMLLARALR